jgi:raffinose/stachyose/melibiose transport system permease protein
MMATTLAPETRVETQGQASARTKRRLRQLNIPGGLAGWIWLAIIIIPIYYVVITSLKTQAGYFGQNPLAPPLSPTLENYVMVLEADFARYFLNSAIITIGAVVPTLAVSFMAAFAIVRGNGRFLKGVNALFLMGLAIPLQATIIPVYLIIIRLSLYDSLLAIILPSIAFAIPLSVLILSNFIRDVPKELFESMRLDGCSEWQTLWRLALPRMERLPSPARAHAESGPPRAAAGAVELPGRVQRQYSCRSGLCRADDAAYSCAVHHRPTPAPRRADRRLQQIITQHISAP